MFIPARKTRGSDPACTRLPRLLTFATTGAVFMGAGFGVMPASADPRADKELSVLVDIVGDSYMAGVGLRDTYIDPADPRHQSTAAPALQALARVQSDNPLLRVDANLAAASGAETVDFFHAQAGPDNVLVNAPQRDQVRPDSQLVIVGFGGEDAQLATVLAEARRTTGGPNTTLDKQIRELGPLLDWTLSDEEYLAQAKSSAPGQASTLVARMLQVVAGIADRAPQAKIVVTTYPLAADPQDEHASTLVGEDELTSVRKFGYDLNQAINRAVQICACGSLADVSEAMAGHEIYTVDSGFNESRDQQAPQESFQPTEEGASLIANPIANVVANVLQITAPKPSDGRPTVPGNIEIRSGKPDRDGDRVVDFEDRAPDDPARSVDTPRDGGDTKHGRDDDRHGRDDDRHDGSRSKHGNDSGQPRGGVLPLILPVVDVLAPGVSPIDPYGQPPTDPTGDNHPGTVESRPSAREQTVPPESPALAPEPATAPPVPGDDDASSWSRAEVAAAEDVVSKAVPAGYVSQYPTQALRVTTVPADVRTMSDKAAVDAQMSQSLLNQPGFQARFGENIDAIHNATTVAEQDTAIAAFNQTVVEYNATELAARDAYGAHPVDAQGETVRVTPISVADLATQTPSYGPVEATTLPAFDGMKTGTVVDPGPLGVPSTPTDATTMAAVGDEARTVTVSAVAGETYGPVDATTMAAVSDQTQTVTVAGETTLSAQTDMSTLAAATGPKTAPSKTAPTKSTKPNIGVNVDSEPDFSAKTEAGPVAEGEISRTSEKDGVTVTGKAEGKALGYEGEISAASGPEGVNGKIGIKGYAVDAKVGMEAESNGDKVGFEGKVAVDGELGMHGKLNGIDNFDAGAKAKVGGEVSMEESGNYGMVEGSTKAKAGVSAEADTHAKVSPDGTFDVASEAFAGAKAGVEGKIGVPGLSLNYGFEGWAGPGYRAGLSYDKTQDGSFKFGAKAGFSPMFGAAGAFSVDVNPDKLRQSVQEAIDAMNPFGPEAPPAPADFDAEYSGPTPGTTGENDDPGYGPAPAEAPADPGYGPAPSEAPADNDAQYSGPTPGTTGENDDPGYGLAPASSEPAEAATPADNDAQYSGPTPGTTGENDDPGYSTNPAADSPVNSDAAISSNTDPASDTITGYSGDDTLTGSLGDDSLGGETDSGYSDAGYSDSGYSDSGAGETSDTSGGYGTSDAGAPGDGTSDGETSGGGFTGGGGDFGGAGATGDFGGTDSPGSGDTTGGYSGDSMGGVGDGSESGGDTSGMGDSGMGGDSGGMGGDSGGMGGDSGGMGGDSGGGVGGGDSGGGDSGGGGMGGGGMSSGTGMGSGGMGGGPSGGDGGGF